MGEGEKPEGGDDLFEDLDKFFAPIRDVDWPEPEEPAPAAPGSAEGHVAVHAPGPGSEPEAEPGGAEPEGAEPEAAEPEAAEPVWYDTAVIEPVPDEGEPIVISDVPPPEVPGQSDLFAGEGEDVPTGEEETAREPWPLETPSDQDVEAAAEHFAEAIRSEEQAPITERAPEREPAPEPVPEPFAESPADAFAGPGEVGGGGVEEDILSDLEEPPGGRRTVKVGAEGLGGPSWQEPASIEVGADLDRQGGRDVPAAFVTGLVLAALAFGGLVVAPVAFALVAGLIVLVAQGELYGVMHRHHRQPATAVGLVTGALILWGAYGEGEGAVLGMLALGMIATLLWFLAVPGRHRKDTLVNVGLTVLNVAYIPVLGSFLLLTMAFGGSQGRALVAAVIALTFVFDTVAFLAGATFGGSSIQRPLAPDTSPKKSWEGVLLASLVTVIVSVGFVGSFVKPFENHQVQSFLLAIVISLAATFGDLAESLIKRDLGIKDMGSILPGHGGVLDRIDSLLFTAPAAYLLFRVLFS
ncbi:MAG: phosphatidate cytidylyltransferase [Actinobacteria bacterium]|nr:phosphatidate cytidylyltransferase [Actinomycetota bacterium]